MTHYLFTSESVAKGHPDKICDQIADSILDACLQQDLESRVGCEVVVSSGLVLLAGEITTHAIVDYPEVARHVIKEIGYDHCELGFDWRSCAVLQVINKQSPDIARGIKKEENHIKEQGAGDQGLMFGFACDETPELMPMPIILAHRLVRELYQQRISGKIPYLRPDGKAQVTVEYTSDGRPKRIHTVVLSAQHTAEVSQTSVRHDIEALIRCVLPAELVDDQTIFYINPTGRFVEGGPKADCGLTGRKTIVDTYGGMGRHGGGSFSGKDPTKVDRAGAYAARYVAKHIVAAKLARRCEVQVSYAIGVAHPISIKVDTFQTGTIAEEEIVRAIPLVFDLSPKGIIEMLDLRRPIFRKTAFSGHFGRLDPDFTWEKTDRIPELLQATQSTVAK